MMRRTKIVCTLGPASDSDGIIEALLLAGMDVARLNFSHGTQETHAATLIRLRAAAERLSRPLAILQDLQGPKIRTGALAGGKPITLHDGQRLTITTRPIEGTSESVSTTYEAFPLDVKPGDRILLSDGAIELRTLGIKGQDTLTEVVHGGVLVEHQGINLPGVMVSAPALTPKDRDDLAFGVRQGVDYIALSFVRKPEDLKEAKRLVAEQTPNDAQPIPIIAKLEKPEAIERLDEILAASDGVMVARGDLGVELPLEQVPLIQKRVIRAANACGIHVITATQMLESMISHVRPTRAEASDVANAILDGTDAVMLSGETAVGAYPVETVRVMTRIAETADTACEPGPVDAVHFRSHAHAVASAAHILAQTARARMIVVLTRSGLSARLISKERPSVPILAFTPSEEVYRRLGLWWGVTPRRSALEGTMDEKIAWVDAYLRGEGLAEPGEEIVIMGGMQTGMRAKGTARTNFVKLHRVGETEA
jgi:pyruvate kinase